FWAIDVGGCNPLAFAIVKGMPAYCGSHVNAFCSGDTNLCELFYVPSLIVSSGMVRLSITAARVPPSTVSLAAGQSYFGFALNITTDGSASCNGCSAPAAIGFDTATINPVYANGMPLPSIDISGTYPGAKPCATVNNGTSVCARVPVQRLSWGRLKSLYR